MQLSRGGVIALVVLTAGTAHAGNDDEVLVGSDASMSGGAVTAMVSSGSALVYNPAGLAGVDDDSINVSVNALTIRRSRSYALLQSSGDRDAAAFSEILVVPAALTWARPATDDIRLAAGIFLRRSSDFLFDSSLQLPGAGGLVHDWLVSVSFTETKHQGVLGIGWRLGKRVQVGATLQAIRSGTSGALQFSGALDDPSSTAVTAFANETSISSSSVWSVGGSAGLQAQLHPRVRIGLAVDTPSVLLHVDSSNTFLFSAEGVPSVGDPAGTFDSLESEVSRGGAELVTPLRARGGVAVMVPSGWVAVDADYTGSLDRKADVGDDRAAVWNARLGGQLELSPGKRLGAGLFTDRDHGTEVTEFGARQIDFYGGTVGFHFDRLSFLPDTKHEGLQLETTVAARYAYGRGDIGGLRVGDDIQATSDVISTPAVSMRVHELSLYISSTITF